MIIDGSSRTENKCIILQTRKGDIQLIWNIGKLAINGNPLVFNHQIECIIEKWKKIKKCDNERIFRRNKKKKTME